MDFSHDASTLELIDRVRSFIDEHVVPAEAVLTEQLAAEPDAWSPRPIVRELQQKARDAGLWNLFLPGERGAGLTNLQYAPLAELTGWSLRLAPAAFNCAAPDTGNMEVLNDFGTPGAEGALARAAARGAHPFGLLHDGARGRVERRHQHHHQHPSRWRRLRHRPVASGGRPAP